MSPRRAHEPPLAETLAWQRKCAQLRAEAGPPDIYEFVCTVCGRSNYFDMHGGDYACGHGYRERRSQDPHIYVNRVFRRDFLMIGDRSPTDEEKAVGSVNPPFLGEEAA